MEQQNPLAQLRPNHLPDPVSWFPPAPGLWLSSLLALILILTGLYLLLRYLRKNRYRRKAIKAGQQILTDYQQHNDQRRLACDCGSLLKRTALIAYPREEVARLHGQEWLEFLARKSNNQAFLQGAGTALGTERYAKDQHVDVQALHAMTLGWIRKHHA